MKRLFLVLFLTLTVSTTTAKVMQVYCLFSSQQHCSFEDEQIKVRIGGAQLIITNKTNTILYLDKANSFVYLNGQTTALFSNASYTTGTEKERGGSIAMGSVAQVAGIRGAVGTLMGGVNVGGSNTRQQSATIHEQRILAIPPHSTQIIYRWESLSPFIYNKIGNGKTIRPRKANRQWFFSQQESPIRLRGVISYATKETMEDIRQISVSDYINEIVTGKRKSTPKDLPFYHQGTPRSYLWIEEGTSDGLKILVCLAAGGTIATFFLMD